MKFVDLRKTMDMIKANLPLYSVMVDYGVSFPYGDEDYKMCCVLPGHDDATPSAKYYKENQNYHCFVCQVDLDVIGFVAKMENISIFAAIERILDKYKSIFAGKQEDLIYKPEETLNNSVKFLKLLKQRVEGNINQENLDTKVEKSLQEKMANDIARVHKEIMNQLDASDFEDRVKDITDKLKDCRSITQEEYNTYLQEVELFRSRSLKIKEFIEEVLDGVDDPHIDNNHE